LTLFYPVRFLVEENEVWSNILIKYEEEEKPAQDMKIREKNLKEQVKSYTMLIKLN